MSAIIAICARQGYGVSVNLGPVSQCGAWFASGCCRDFFKYLMHMPSPSFCYTTNDSLLLAIHWDSLKPFLPLLGKDH